MQTRFFIAAPVALAASLACTWVAAQTTTATQTTATAERSDSSPSAKSSQPAPVYVAPTVTVRDSRERADMEAADLARRQPENLKKLLDDDPSVNVMSMGAGQMGDIEIRGMGGTSDTLGTGANQVTMEVDGMEVAQSLNFGHNMRFGREYLDPQDLKAVRIQKGPGASGLAGSVQMRTKDPEDYLKPGQTFGGDVRVGRRSDERNTSLGVTLAAKFSESAQGSVSFTRRSYGELDNAGGVARVGTQRTASNPLDGTSNALNAKLVLSPSAAHRLTFGLQHFDSERITDMQTDIGSSVRRSRPPAPVVTRRTDTHAATNVAETRRNALFVRHEWLEPTAWFDSATTQLSIQRSSSKGNNRSTVTQTTTPPGTVTQGVITSRNNFDINNITLNTQMDKTLGAHSLSYGLRVQRGKSDMDSFAENIVGGISRGVTESEYLGTQTQWSVRAHVADRISVSPDLDVTPSLSVNHVRIKPSIDKITSSERGTADTQAVLRKYSKTAVGFGLRADWRFMPGHVASVSLTRATRLPGFGEVGAQSYGHWPARPNPNLKPERADGLELSWLSRGEWGRQKTTLFINRYQDLIAADCGPNYSADWCDIINESGRSTTRGIEFSGSLDLARVVGAPHGLNLSAGVALMRGKDYLGRPRTRIEPLTGHVALGFEHPSGQWGMEAKLRFASGKKQKDLPPASRGVPAPLAGWSTLDLTVNAEPVKNLHVQAGIYNVFDRQYAKWSRVRGIPAAGAQASKTRAMYTEPGRSFGLNVQYKF